VTAAMCGILQLKTLNTSMELYDQVETIPVYNSSLIFFNIAAGAIVMQEYKLYKWYEFIFVILCGIISIIGVYVIVHRPKTIKK
jgi:fatty-acid desaturase